MIPERLQANAFRNVKGTGEVRGRHGSHVYNKQRGALYTTTLGRCRCRFLTRSAYLTQKAKTPAEFCMCCNIPARPRAQKQTYMSLQGLLRTEARSPASRDTHKGKVLLKMECYQPGFSCSVQHWDSFIRPPRKTGYPETGPAYRTRHLIFLFLTSLL